MSVAVPVIAGVDGTSRKVYLKDGVRSYHPVDDLVAELQQLRSDDENHRWYYPLIIEQGGVFKGGTTYTGKYALFQQGAEVIPADDIDHDLNIIGEQIDGLGKVGIELVNKTSLVHSVNINYLPPPTTEIKVISTGSVVTAQDKVDIASQASIAVWQEAVRTLTQSAGLTTEESAKLLSIPTANENALELLDNIDLNTI